MEFLLFLIRRVLWSILVLVGLSIVIFLIARVVPGDPARMATQQQVADDILALVGPRYFGYEVDYRPFVTGA